MFDLSLCLVTDPDLVPADALVETVLAAVRGGVTMVQLRDKHASDDALGAQAESLLRVLNNVPLIINDRIDVARRVKAQGVHVGQEDDAPELAREALGSGAIIGLSITHERQLPTAELAPVDYYGVGPYWATPTKPDHDPALGLDRARAIVATASRPCLAIGGITAERAESVRATGVAGLAVVSAIFGKPDPERAARALVISRAEVFA